MMLNHKRKQTEKRHELLRSKIYDMAKQNFNKGIRDYVAQAIKTIHDETGFSESYLKDVYYGRT